jgi:hypothetical protein
MGAQKKSIKWTFQNHAVNMLSGLKWLRRISNSGLLFTTIFKCSGLVKHEITSLEE